MTPLEIEQSENLHLRERIDELTNQLAINHSRQADVFGALRFQLTGAFSTFAQWDPLSSREFARELYVAVRRLQTERDEAVNALERVRTVVAVHDATVRLNAQSEDCCDPCECTDPRRGSP